MGGLSKKVKCAVSTCSSKLIQNPRRKFFRVPKELKRCKQWIKLAGRLDLIDKEPEFLYKNYHICDLHFHDSDCLDHMVKKVAVPYLHLPRLKNENPEKSTQTDKAIDEKEEQKLLTKSLKRKLPSDLQGDITKCTKCNTSDSTSADIISPLENSTTFLHLVKLIYLQKNLKHRKQIGLETIDLLALKLCMTQPQAYKVIQELLHLQNEKKLCKDYIDIDTKLTGNALTCLEMKTKNMINFEKYCIVYAEKIDLHCDLYYQINKDKIIGFHDINGVQAPEPATHAIVIEARGIFSEWEQPLTYCLLSRGEHNEELNVWFNDTLSQLIRIGLKVTALVSGYEKIFTDVAKMWGATVAKPYFFVNEKKIYCVFDFCKLVKSLRDKLMERDFLFHDAEGNEIIATWEDVKTVYAIDSQRQYPLAPELTENHVSPSEEDKLKTELVTQVFSQPVAAAMTFFRELGQLGEKSAGTIKLIEIVNAVLKILNSSLDLTGPADESNQREVIEQLIYFLNNVTVLDRDTYNDITKTVKCLRGLKATLKSIVELSQDFKSKGFTELRAGKILKNPSQKCVRSMKAESFRKRTPLKLCRVFKKYFVHNLLKHSKHSDRSAHAIQQVLNMDLNSGVETFQGKVKRSLMIGTRDYCFDGPEEYSLVYVCGYLLKKCYDIHKCVYFKQYLQNDDHVGAEYYKELRQLSSIILPPKDFMQLVEQMDTVFTRYFQRKKIHFVGNDIKDEINKMLLDLCCPCFPFEYLAKLFIRFRILNVINANKINFQDDSFKWKCFCLYNI